MNTKSPLIQLFEHFGFRDIGTEDQLSFSHDNGLVRIKVSRVNGVIQKYICLVDENYKVVPVLFVPADATRKETVAFRNTRIIEEYLKDRTTEDLVELFDVSKTIIDRLVTDYKRRQPQ